MMLPWPPTWTELTALLMALGGGFGWLERRRGRMSQLEARVKTLEKDLATAMEEAEKTDRSHAEALQAKNAEIAEWRRQVERKDDRITSLEDRLYTGGGRP